MIALLGATGYTGRLVAAELARRGLPHRLGGRNPERLGALPRTAGAETFVVDVDDPDRLDLFMDGADALITTVGPFTRLGMPVVEAAVRTSTAYVDSTGETGFMEEVYRRFPDTAAPVVPACGFDFVPGDLAAAVAAADAGGAPTSVEVGYELAGMVPSRGTAMSAVEVLGGAGLPSTRPMTIEWPEGPRPGVGISWGEAVTVPRHLPGAAVRVGLSAPAALAPVVGSVAAVLRPLAGALRALVSLLPEGPPERLRRRYRFRIVVWAGAPGGRRAGVLCEGGDVYGLTARLLVQAALDVAGRGALTPAQALEPVPFLDAVTGEGFSWRRLSSGGEP